jgi:non-canonical poly(A) RNA polymerase PAPD5/7
MQMDISLQDSKHYGLKCVELVKSYMNEYEALEPLIFGLKNLLKNANLNDPYTVI